MQNNWPIKKLGEVIEINYGKGLPKENRMDSGKYFAYGSNGPVYGTDKSLTKSETIVIGRKGTAGALYFISDPCWPIDTTFFAIPKSDASLKFVYYLLRTKKLPRLAIVTGVPGINRTTLANINIQLPPLATQKQIVERLDKIAEAQKLNDELIQKTDELFQSLLHKELNPAGEKNWEIKKLGDIAEVTSSKRIYQSEYVEDGIPFYRTKEIVELSQNKPISLELFISQKRYDEIKSKFGVPGKREILISAVGTIGISWIVSDDREFYFKDGNLLWIKNINGAEPAFLKIVLDNFAKKISQMGAGGAYNALTIIKLKKIQISVPPIKHQKKIVAKLSAVQDYKKQLLEQKSKLKELFNSALAKSMKN